MNSGVYPLVVKQIGAALTADAQVPVLNLGGMQAVTLEASLAYGSGGTGIVATVQTSFDGGISWRDVARFDFSTVSVTKLANLSGMTPKGVAAAAALGAEGVSDGFLGDRLRAVLTSVGTYVDTVLSIRASVR